MTTTLDTAAGVLGGLRSSRRVEMAEQARQLELACEWAYLHPAESIDTDAAKFGDSPVTVAGPGAPLVSEFCVAEFGAAIGASTDSGKYLIGEALEIKHRLPRLWQRVQALEVPVWRARRIARETIPLSKAAAAFVDAQIAHLAHKVGVVVLDRLIQEAMARFMPDEAAEQALAAQDRRGFSVDHRQVSMHGTSRAYGELDLPDAQDVDAAVAAEAQRLADAGSTESLAVRRAKALGNIARRDLGSNNPETAAKKTELVLHLAPGSEIAREQKTGAPIVRETVREWLANPFMTVTVKPVIDLDQHIHVAQYEVPDRLAFQDGGATCSANIAPLCRRHHRLKTHHGAWTITVIEPGTYLWRSPHGYQFLRDHTGTQDITRDAPTDRAGP